MSIYGRPSSRDRDVDDEVVEIETVDVAVPADADGADDTADMQEEIEQTRSDMSETIDAIQQKLSPQRIGEQVREQVHDATIGRAEQMVSDVTDTARQAGGGILGTIRENPVPTALAALGLGWLWMKRPSSSRSDSRGGRYGSYAGIRGDDAGGYGYPDYDYPRGYSGYRSGADGGGVGGAARQSGRRAQQTMGRAAGAVQGAAGQATDAVQGAAGQAVDAVQGVAGQASGAVQQAAGQVHDSAQQLGSQVQYGARRAKYGLEDALQENPLGMGAIALAVGVAVGLAAPSTNLENQFMGDTRDTVMHKAQETAQDTLQKVQHVAQHTVETTKETAQQEAQKEGLTSSKG